MSGKPPFVHESSYVDDGAVVGPGTRIWHFCHVMGGARIGAGCNIGQNVFVASGVTIGDNVKIQNNVSVYTGVILEDDVFLGPSMVFTNVINPRSHVIRRDEYLPTRVGKGAIHWRQRHRGMRRLPGALCFYWRGGCGHAGCARLWAGVWQPGAPAGLDVPVRCAAALRSRRAG